MCHLWLFVMKVSERDRMMKRSKAVAAVLATMLLVPVFACGAGSVDVCVNLHTRGQVDNDFCEPEERVYDPDNFGVISVPRDEVTNEDAIMDASRASKTGFKAPDTKKSTKPVKRKTP